MKSNLLPGPGKVAWQDNKPFLRFILSLLVILSILQIIFYRYNHPYIFATAGETNSFSDTLRMIKWSLLNDLFILALFNTPLLLLLHLGRLISGKWISALLFMLFVSVNSLILLINLGDIFYFPFHFQRANADLLFVLKHPLSQLFRQPFPVILCIVLGTVLVIFFCSKLCRSFFRAFTAGNRALASLLLLLAAFGLLSLNRTALNSSLLPTRPLVELNSSQLLVVQNSMHTFLYSVFRSEGSSLLIRYMPDEQCDSLMPVRKTLATSLSDSSRRNVVLFIMESVAYDFFDGSGPYKVQMPFFDSLLQKSSFYYRAFCYAHQSNKGITAILAGIPTLSDIPVYHSAGVNMPVTRLGTILRNNGYRSLFCIGDDHDDFGFAKCVNWLGFDQYYSKEDIPGYRNLPRHTMGIQDEFVLGFFEKKISEADQPFLAVQYNISTHYPYDLPEDFKQSFPAHYTRPMKSMAYYDRCLGQFFAKAEKEPWFRNTVFLFCSDHWLVPDDTRKNFNAFSGYRIPIILYDPAHPEKKTISRPVSQFDIPGTILGLTSYKDGLISYGYDLQTDDPSGNIVFSRANANLYQATDSAFILGFNRNTGKPEFLYRYTTDPALEHNLLANEKYKPVLDQLGLKMKAFLQKATMQYHGKPFK